jgi:hypothetical protein
LLQQYARPQTWVLKDAYSSCRSSAAEDLEYLDVLEKAVAETDPVARMAFVAAFAVSGYACTKLRASRKPL